MPMQPKKPLTSFKSGKKDTETQANLATEYAKHIMFNASRRWLSCNRHTQPYNYTPLAQNY